MEPQNYETIKSQNHGITTAKPHTMEPQNYIKTKWQDRRTPISLNNGIKIPRNQKTINYNLIYKIFFMTLKTHILQKIKLYFKIRIFTACIFYIFLCGTTKPRNHKTMKQYNHNEIKS